MGDRATTIPVSIHVKSALERTEDYHFNVAQAPLLSPLIDLMFFAGIMHYFIYKHFHPESASADSFHKLLLFFAAFLIIDFLTSALAFALERKHPASKGDAWLLVHIWIQRFTYRQVFSIVLFKTIKRAIDGKPFNWDKLERTAMMSKQV